MTESFTNAPGQRLDLPDPTVAMTGTTLGGSPYKVVGTVMQALMVQINRGQAFFSETGSLSWMTDGVKMDTNLGSGGLMGAFQRVVTRESLFVVNFTAETDRQMATFSSEFPGKIIPVHLAQGQSIIAQKDTLLVARNRSTCPSRSSGGWEPGCSAVRALSCSASTAPAPFLQPWTARSLNIP